MRSLKQWSLHSKEEGEIVNICKQVKRTRLFKCCGNKKQDDVAESD